MRTLGVMLVATILWAWSVPSVAAAEKTAVEWQVSTGQTYSASNGRMGDTDVLVELRETPTAHGRRYDVRLRNRSGRERPLQNGGGTDYTTVALRIRIPRAGTATQAAIDGVAVDVPADVRQWWEPSKLAGTQYGFAYAIKSGDQEVRRVGPSTKASQWGGRSSGIVRIDGRAYVVPEFWERQPRRITVTATEIVLTLVDGQALLRAGEDAWDRFAVLDGALDDQTILDEAEALPSLTAAQRQALAEHFKIAPEGLKGPDATAEALLRRYDRWQGTSWEKSYATRSAAREGWPGEDDSAKTTLFSLFRRGRYYAVAEPGAYTWRNYGDIQWAGGMASGHYDWVRAAFKHYVKTGNRDALRWGMAAMRHAISVDYVWMDYWSAGDAGLARYEKGDHGAPNNWFPPKRSHVWVEGLFLAAAVSGDPWVREAAVRRVEGLWNAWGGKSPAVWNNAYSEVRWVTWPMLALVRGFEETGDLRYWTKAKELMSELARYETASGAKGYIKNTTPYGLKNLVWVSMHGYATLALLELADVAIQRNEWTPAWEAMLARMGTWAITPLPNGPYDPPAGSKPYGAFSTDGWCPAEDACGQATDKPSVNTNALFVDLFAWLAQRDPEKWAPVARQVFHDFVNYAQNLEGRIGYLTDDYPSTETKILGRAQLFGDRAARWLHTSAPARSAERK